MKRYFFFLLLLLLAACSMPETRMYSLSLSASGDKAQLKSGASVNVSVHCARYLTQPYIAYRVSPYQLDMARYSRWEASPEQMLRESLRDSLSGIFRDVSTSVAAASDFYSLDVNLKRFERSDEGADSYAELVMDVRLSSPDGKEIYRGAISKKVKLEDRTFLGLAKALSAMLSDGEHEIMDGVSKALPSGNGGSS